MSQRHFIKLVEFVSYVFFRSLSAVFLAIKIVHILFTFYSLPLCKTKWFRFSIVFVCVCFLSLYICNGDKRFLHVQFYYNGIWLNIILYRRGEKNSKRVSLHFIYKNMFHVETSEGFCRLRNRRWRSKEWFLTHGFYCCCISFIFYFDQCLFCCCLCFYDGNPSVFLTILLAILLN